MKPANYAPVYAAMYPRLAEKAREHGYALAIHGSMARDMDVVAVPWTDQAVAPEELVKALVAGTSADLVGGPPTEAPHGRLIWTLSLGFGECAVDLSVMPRDYHSTAPRCHSCGGWVKPQEGGTCLACDSERGEA